MKRNWLSVIAIIAVTLSVWAGMPATRVQSAGTIQYYPSSLPRNATFSGTVLSSGTPFAVYVQVTGAPANTTCNGPKIRLMSASSGGTADTNFRTWTGSTNGWQTDSGSWASFPTISTDAAGTWSGWAYGAVPTTVTNTWLAVRINCGSNVETTRIPITLMDMSTSGGWLEETLGSTRAGRAIVVKNGPNIVGMYVAENNAVSEGYGYAAGGYRVAVPNCTSCGYTVETWDLATPNTSVGITNVMGAGGCPSDVSAGSTTSLDTCTSPSAVTLNDLTASTPAASPAPIAFGLMGLTAAALLLRRKATRPIAN